MSDVSAAPSNERRTPGWVPIVIGLAAFLVVGAAAGLLAIDWTWRNMEMDALVTAVETSEAAMGRTQDDLSATSRMLEGVAKPTDAEKAGLLTAMIAGASRGEDRIGAAGTAVAQVQVAPWHRAIIDAKVAYLAHNMTWQDYMAAIAADPKVYGTDQPAIDETFMAADPLMRRAVPMPALFELAQRVNRIFVEGSGPPPAAGGQEVLLRIN